MKILKLVPYDFAMTLVECPPGHFLFDDRCVGFKSEYRNAEGNIEAYNEAGEFFWGGTSTHKERHLVKVIPLHPQWEEADGE